MVKSMWTKLWNDDGGALIATEFLFVATILIIGIVAGLSAVRSAVNAELSELANAILALSQGYSVSGVTGCCSTVDGSEAIDTPALVTAPACTPAANPSVVDVVPCQ